MTRILYWNIQQFGINKINNPNRKRQRGSSLPQPAASDDRKRYILDTLAANPVDIFVVVETNTGAGAPGTHVTASGETGALNLLTEIRIRLGITWRLVPPLILGIGGVSEGISVYYNSANLFFTGPWFWQGGANPAIAPAPPLVGVRYAPPWRRCLPATPVPAASPINPGIPMNRLAGQWQFHGPPPVGGGAAPVLQFPGPNSRTPFLTTFWDTTGAGRTIKLLSYHAPPNSGLAANGTSRLSNILEMTTNLGANEVGVIVGDFNVDLYSPFAALAYGRLTNMPPLGVGYTRLLNRTTANAWPDKGYVGTHIKSRHEATPWNTNGYPGYGYIGSSNMFQNYDSIDNALVRYGTGFGPPPPHNMTIVNRVTGSPYNRVVPAPGGAATPTGNYAYQSAMTPIGIGANPLDPIALPLPPPAPGGLVPGNIGGLARFRGWDNYGHIRSTSDHMALIFDV